MSLTTVLDLLRCPACQQELSNQGRSVGCVAGHRFDPARQGYLNLLGRGQPANADSAAMVQARERFLSGGHYAPMVDALVAASTGAEVITDVGAGPGRYLSAALDRGAAERGVALDVSVPACRRAARAHPRLGAVVADTWQPLPLRDAASDVVWCVFAPRNFPEFTRVLRPGGRVVVVTPLPEHLIEVRTALGLLGIEEDKSARLRDAAESLRHTDGEDLRFELSLAEDALSDLVAMGPNAFHTDPGTTSRTLAQLTLPIQVTVAVRISVFVR